MVYGFYDLKVENYNEIVDNTAATIPSANIYRLSIKYSIGFLRIVVFIEFYKILTYTFIYNSIEYSIVFLLMVSYKICSVVFYKKYPIAFYKIFSIGHILYFSI